MCSRKFYRFFSIVGLFWLLIYPVLAQEDEQISVITITNVQRLHSVIRVDFDVLPKELEGFHAGWFALSPDGEKIAVINSNGHFARIIPAQQSYSLVAPPFPDETPIRAIDALLGRGEYDLFAYSDGNHYYLAYDNDLVMQFASSNLPQSLWTDSDNAFVHIEILPADPQALPFILQMPFLDNNFFDSAHSNLMVVSENSYPQLPYAPIFDTDAIVRIGRIEPPYVVTSSADGIVKLWNLAWGKLVAEVDNGTGTPAVFGNINHGASHLVWRDEQSESLYLLNFHTGENRKIADLNGEYVQWFFLSADASVILGVNVDFEPVIVAWDTKTGEKITLGEYRECNRPQPDMARLSHDGSTLVIGCDTGLDIWRVRS